MMEVSFMPFKQIDVDILIADTLNTHPELKEIWDNSQMEYRLLGELVKLRKEKGFSQVELAQKSGNKQQVISRIENRENSPTLKTVCSILNALDYDIIFVPQNKKP